MGDDGNGHAFLAGAARAADAMDVAFAVKGQVIVKDMADVVDVQAASGDICGDQYFKLAIAETGDDGFTVLLFHVTVQTPRFVALRDQKIGQTIHLFLVRQKMIDLLGRKES